MKGVMRKRLLALLSAAGLAGTVAPASGQVLKGDQAERIQPESTLKANKAKQENAAAKNAANVKLRKDAGSKDASIHPDALTVKQKGRAETNAAHNDDWIKAGKGGAGSKTKTKTHKGNKSFTDDWEQTGATGGSGTGHKKGASDNWTQTEAAGHQQNLQNKAAKNTAESKATKTAICCKSAKNAAASAAQSEANKK